MDGQPGGTADQEKRQHVDSFKRPTFEPSTEVGIRSGLREDLYMVFAGRGGRHRGSGLPVQHQSAGLVGLVRRIRAGVRRHRDDVAGRRADASAPSRRAQGGYGVVAGGRREGVSAMARRAGEFFLGRGVPGALGLARARAGRRRCRIPWPAGGRSARCAIPTPWAGRGRRPDPEENDARDPGDRASGWPATAAARSTSSPAAPPTSPAPTRPSCTARCWRCGKPGEVRPAGARRVRGEVRREGADGAEAEGIQPGGLSACPAPRSRRRARRWSLFDRPPASGGGRRAGGAGCGAGRAGSSATPEELERLRQALAEVED